MLKKSEAIKNFLSVKTHEDLAQLYNHSMEVQVIVAQGSGERIEGDYKGRKYAAYTDGIQTWKPFRIPLHANSIPEDNDNHLTFDLAVHADGIGMTGWDWENKKSLWVAYDFDSIVGHSDKHINKLSDQELKIIEDRVSDVPWVTVRRSTSGNGRHIYIFLDGVDTENHTEHSALARSILGMLSTQTGYDLNAKVDTCGGNMWVWHRKMEGTKGLEVIKKGETLYNIPLNWKDHIEVVTGRQKKIRPSFVEAPDLFEELTGQRNHVPFDDEHRKIIKYLEDNGWVCYYDQDHHMIITHTYGLKEAHEHFSLKGLFNTNSPGHDKSTPNCFMFALRKGGWTVRRYSPGIQEEMTWDQDGSGWTRCYLNVRPDLKIVARSCDGKEDSTGGFYFSNAELAQKAARILGADLQLPNAALMKKATLKEHRDGRLIAKIDYDAHSDAQSGGFQDWIQKGRHWERLFNVQISEPIETEVGNYDDLVRHLVNESGDDSGWVLKSNDIWKNEPINHVTKALKTLNLASKEVEMVLGVSIFKCWTLVNRPFESEYPGDRMWNRKAAQFRYAPSQDIDNLNYPTWLKLISHVSKSLNEVIKDNAWAQSNGIITGNDYIKCWIASLFQYPREPLPYLFFYGPENSGKSSFHEALGLLITEGVKRADTALTSSSNFNGELANAVLCIVEETNLRQNKEALNKIKDWVTSPIIPIHPKGGTPYDIPNTTHWIQAANQPDFCPIFPGDTRIVMLYVEELKESIPKKEFYQLLIKEAPDFMAAILNLELPPSNDRLHVPVIITEEKIQAEKANRTLLQIFIEENCHHIDGEVIKFSEFCDKFWESIDPNYVHDWSKHRISRELPVHYPSGRITVNNMGGAHYIGNISWSPFNGGDKKPKYFKRKDNIVQN